jgi:hypothetical protein
MEGVEEEVRVTAWPSGYPRWLGPCILGDICGSYHMPEVCQMFEAMSPEGRLSVIQKKRLCQFCLRHPDTQQCPSHSQPACPIRVCMRMHHRMLHRALLREEARPVMLEMAQDAGGRYPEENPLTSDSEDQHWLPATRMKEESQRRLAYACRWCLLRQRAVRSKDFTPYMIGDLQ